MNIDTGEIKEEKDLTPAEKDSKRWVRIPPADVQAMKTGNRAQRRTWLKENRKRLVTIVNKDLAKQNEK